MAKLVKRKRTTLFVECRECEALLECSPNDILNVDTDDWLWDTYVLKGQCPKCKHHYKPDVLYSHDYFVVDLVSKVTGGE